MPDQLRAALKGKGDWTVEIVKRSDTAKDLEVLPRRRVVERTFAWFGRCRRLAKDWETSLETSTAWAFIASIKIMTAGLQHNVMSNELLNPALCSAGLMRKAQPREYYNPHREIFGNLDDRNTNFVFHFSSDGCMAENLWCATRG